MALSGINGASNTNNGYRDFWNNYFKDETDDKDENKTDGTGGIDFGTTKFVDKKEGISVTDFLGLMVAQLKNQDFTNPVDDTQYVTQLAQFATMQQMEELAANSKLNYVASLIGKEATVAKLTVAGNVDQEKGIITKISLVNNEYKIYIGDGKKSYTLEQIMQIHEPKKEADPGKPTDPTKPVDPADPSKPADPTDPTNPTDPKPDEKTADATYPTQENLLTPLF